MSNYKNIDYNNTDNNNTDYNNTDNNNNTFNYHTMDDNNDLKIFTNKIINKNILFKGIMNKNKKLPPYINMSQTDKEICECLICFDEIDKDKTYVKCYTCKHYYHIMCANEWFFKKNKGKKNKCSYCQQKTLKSSSITMQIRRSGSGEAGSVSEPHSVSILF